MPQSKTVFEFCVRVNFMHVCFMILSLEGMTNERQCGDVLPHVHDTLDPLASNFFFFSTTNKNSNHIL